jgi:hypothetical protein
MLRDGLLFSFRRALWLLSMPATSTLDWEAGVPLNDEYLLCEQKVNGEERFFLLFFVQSNGAPGQTRTGDPLLRRQTLYPTELRAHGFPLILRHLKFRGAFF